jgi:hypothetical protein
MLCARSVVRGLFAVAAGAWLGCSATVATQPDASAPADAPTADAADARRVPLRHRATASACPSARPASTCDPGSGGPPAACAADAECTTGVNGRCVGNPRDGCRCNYDACSADTECTLGGPCECRLASRGASGANVCIAGNCRVDADCGAGGYCSPTLGSCGDFGGLAGYYCHTAADQCVDDADCATILDGGFLGQRPYCMYARETGRWVCSNAGCAG